MDRPGFEYQSVPTFYLLSKCPEPLRYHPVFCSIGTERFNREQNGWGVMPPTTLYSAPRLRKSGYILPSTLIYNRYSGTLRTAVTQWLRWYATNRKVAGSIPASVSRFFIDIKSFRSDYGPGDDSANNRNQYQEYFLGVQAAGA